MRANATEFCKGNALCQYKAKGLLKEVGLPTGLLPLQDMEEFGYVKDTGFVWFKSKKNTDHKFEKIGKLAQYGSEVTAYVEQKKIKKMTGVKAKELFLWVTISEISVDDPPTGKIYFKSPLGIGKTFPVSAFENPEDEKEEKEEQRK
ncbi:unnamed protein product [Cuscuta epithymum]|uniref:Uncharacterized protein n=1 Tax=Cuscuta epithymum TaxID=186058 RepID=A0AAV0G411_9ASTE|nr:unnamed protein product [Cuscuta epithymum]